MTEQPAPDPSAAPEVDQQDAAPPAGLWDRMKADPQYAPEHLALEAVKRIGPQAQEWLARTRRTYPHATPDEVARMAVFRFTNMARISGATSGAVGIAGAVLDIGFLAWTQARMVLHIAAAYGVDPTHSDRATDLLVLQKVHKYAEGARLALGVAQGRERIGSLMAKGRTPLGRALGKLGVKLAQMAGIRAAKRLFAKVVPGAAIILGAWANSSATKDLAGRTIELYRFAGTTSRPAALPAQPPAGPPAPPKPE